MLPSFIFQLIEFDEWRHRALSDRCFVITIVSIARGPDVLTATISVLICGGATGGSQHPTVPSGIRKERAREKGWDDPQHAAHVVDNRSACKRDALRGRLLMLLLPLLTP